MVEEVDYSTHFARQSGKDYAVTTNATIGVRVRASGVTFKNFELTYCRDAVDVDDATDVNLENLLIHKVGSTSLPNGWDGIAISCDNMDNSLIYNCYIVDAHGQGVRLGFGSDDNGVLYTVVVSSNSNTSPHAGTDYYFNISNSSCNAIYRCYAERFHEKLKEGNQWVSGHKGFVIQGTSTGNDITYCDALRLLDAFLLRGNGVSGNDIEDCVSIGDSDTPWEAAYGQISILNGAHDNCISRVRVQGGDYGVSFENTTGDDPTSNNNVFDNCIIQDSKIAAVRMDQYNDSGAAYVENTSFVHCTFVNSSIEGAFIENYRNGLNNLIERCIITRFSDFESDPQGEDHGFDFEFCCIFGNAAGAGFPTPFEDGDPKFAPTTMPHQRFGDLDTWDLTSESPCIDRVVEYSGISLKDHDQDLRPSGPGTNWDIGAQEY